MKRLYEKGRMLELWRAREELVGWAGDRVMADVPEGADGGAEPLARNVLAYHTAKRLTGALQALSMECSNEGNMESARAFGKLADMAGQLGSYHLEMIDFERIIDTVFGGARQQNGGAA